LKPILRETQFILVRGLREDKNLMSTLLSLYLVDNECIVRVHPLRRLGYIFIFIVWELSHNVQLDLNSNSYKFCLLIIILASFNRIDYTGVYDWTPC
jgi:hypothetical protein